MNRYTGVLGPVIYFAMALIIAAILPEFNLQTQMISELGATGSQYSQIFNLLGFLPNGIFIIAFGVYFYSQLKTYEFSPWPAILVIVHGIGMMLVAYFSCDLACMPTDPSLKHIGHNIIGGLMFPALQVAILIFAIQLFKRGQSKTYAYGSIFTFIVAGVFFALFSMSIESRDFTGGYQWLFIGTLYIWLAVVCFKLDAIMARQPLNHTP